MLGTLGEIKCPKGAMKAWDKLVAQGKAQRMAGYGSFLVVIDIRKIKVSGWACGLAFFTRLGCSQ